MTRRGWDDGHGPGCRQVGLNGVDLGPWIWNREHVLATARGVIRLRERYFVALAQTPHVDTSGFEPEEARVVTGHRWMSIENIAAIPTMGHLVAPRRFAELLPPILVGDYPPEPFDLGI